MTSILKINVAATFLNDLFIRGLVFVKSTFRILESKRLYLFTAEASLFLFQCLPFQITVLHLSLIEMLHGTQHFSLPILAHTCMALF